MRGNLYTVSLMAVAALLVTSLACIANAEDSQPAPVASAVPQEPQMIHQQSLGNSGLGGLGRSGSQAQDIKDIEDALGDNMKGRDDVEGLQILRLGAAVLNMRDIE